MIDTVVINAKIVTPNNVTRGCIAIDGDHIGAKRNGPTLNRGLTVRFLGMV